MSRPDGSRDGASVAGALDGARDRLREVGVVRAVVVVALIALAARFVLLGARSAHWDEARVGYWILHTIETGDFAYRRIIHGPLIQHTNHVVFSVVGASDVTMRAGVAVVGGLLPLTALLFREHLEDDETVILALFLGFSAVLVYYSRFMRSDVLVAAFMFAGLGLLVRFYDTRRWRYVYGAAAAVALGFGSKENAVVYLLTWLGAAALLADQALYRPRRHENGFAFLSTTWLAGAARWLWALPDRLLGRGTVGSGDFVSRARRAARRTRDPSTRAGWVARWLGHPAGALAVFVLIIIFLYAPRGAGAAGLRYPPAAETSTLGLYEALGRPATLPGFAVETLADTAQEFGEWFGQSADPACSKDNVIDGWLCFLGRYLEVMRDHAVVLSVFGGLGFLYERYAAGRSRNLVLFATYAGIASVIGYPLGTDVFGAWLVVHAVVPLAVPAAVGVAVLYRWGRDARRDGDDAGAAIVALVLMLLAGQVAVATVGGVYTNHSDRTNSLVQYAQPGQDLDPLVAAMDRSVATDGDGADVVLYYGEVGDARSDRQAIVAEVPQWEDGDLLTEPPCAEWFNLLPLPWYFGTTGAAVECDDAARDLAERAGTKAPGVIITVSEDNTVPAEDLRAAGYQPAVFQIRSHGTELTVYAHERIGGFGNP